MSLAEKTLNLYAPTTCIVCYAQGASMCSGCMADVPKNHFSRCFMCGVQTDNFATCSKCIKKTVIKNAWVAVEYNEVIKDLVHGYKYERNRSSAPILAEFIANSLPYLTRDTVVTHIPTATSRVRARGYDHSLLLAKELAKTLGLKHRTLLGRIGQTQQMGAKRKERLVQAQKSYVATKKIKSPVLLVDDVLTTGATLSAGARELKKSGTSEVLAAVLTHNSTR